MVAFGFSLHSIVKEKSSVDKQRCLPQQGQRVPFVHCQIYFPLFYTHYHTLPHTKT